MNMTKDPRRKSELALIHMARSHFSMTRDDYVYVLRELTGKESSADLNAVERERVIKHFKAKGFQVKPTGKAKQTRTLAQDAQSRKVRAIWLMLHVLGQVRDPSEVALAAYTKRMAKVDALQWANHFAVIEGLKGWAMRHLPDYVKPRIQAMDLNALTAGQREDVLNMVNSLRRAQAEGHTALFDYYWPMFQFLQECEQA
ncbi:gp16 family protein [Rhodoferax aquaticus]|nr:regulatory protein GemA [Rhodoferax aquaticus]